MRMGNDGFEFVPGVVSTCHHGVYHFGSQYSHSSGCLSMSVISERPSRNESLASQQAVISEFVFALPRLAGYPEDPG